MKRFYTVVLRKSLDHWVALCLENGCVGQGATREEAVDKLRLAVSSLVEATRDDPDISVSPVSIKRDFLRGENLDKRRVLPKELRAGHRVQPLPPGAP